jgi:hypothetical protein
MITQSQLKSLLHYDAETGVFTWLSKPCRRIRVGDVASNARWDGYVRVGVLGKRYLAHRLAWLYVYGEWPKQDIDHINCNPGDNSIANLRECTNSQNQMNAPIKSSNKSGFKGVVFTKGKWQANGCIEGKTKYLGRFADPAVASKAYEDFSRVIHGEFKHQGAQK